MKKKTIVGLIAIIVSIVLIATLAWHIEKEARIEELSKMALTEADLPEGYSYSLEFMGGKTSNFDEPKELVGAKTHYQKGYRGFKEISTDKYKPIHILEDIVTCSSPEIIPTAVNWTMTFYDMYGSWYVTQLPNPDVGDFSTAHRLDIKTKGDPRVGRLGERVLVLDFRKNNKWVKIRIWGDDADYVLLKELATKAEKKIK